MGKILLFNKPFGVICQFSRDGIHPTLADYIALPDFYPAGRLDTDSEGLLVLTDDGQLQHRITDPKHKLPKTYWVQVEGVPDEAALEKLRLGVRLRHVTAQQPIAGAAACNPLPHQMLTRTVSGVQLSDFITQPAEARVMDEPAKLWARNPPIRSRKNIPTSWLELIIHEGKNRQVRRMTAAVGLPTLRLIRYRIGEWTLNGIEQGKWRFESS